MGGGWRKKKEVKLIPDWKRKKKKQANKRDLQVLRAIDKKSETSKASS
jgi:hypothetical protein